jgi:hypothetical protein
VRKVSGMRSVEWQKRSDWHGARGHEGWSEDLVWNKFPTLGLCSDHALPRRWVSPLLCIPSVPGWDKK